MNEVQTFIAAAVELERHAAERYEELADAITGQGASDVVSFFREQASLSRRHMQQANAWSAFRDNWDGTDQAESQFTPAGQPDPLGAPFCPIPEELPPWAADGFLSIDDAMSIALRAEESACAYFTCMAYSAEDPDVRRLATELAREEAGHINRVKAVMVRAAPA